MSEVIGKKVTCPRCDTEVFLKYLGTTDLDGGFTRYSKFEELPNDWTHIVQLGGSLCPDCSHQFKSWVKNFMGYGKSISASWSLEE